MTKLLYLGHGSLRLTTNAGRTIYIDPFMSPKGQGSTVGYDVPADLVLVTHQHYDHTAIDKMPHTATCIVWQNTDAHPSTDKYVTQRFLGGEVEVQAVEAYNGHHPKDACVGYVVRVDGLALYFAGDTGPTDQMAQMADWNLDYAFLPGDGIYTMTPEVAARCAEQIGARHAVPIHLKPVEPYGKREAARFAAETPNALLVRPGAPVDLT